MASLKNLKIEINTVNLELFKIAVAAMRYCNERYDGNDRTEAKALNELENLLSTLPVDLCTRVLNELKSRRKRSKTQSISLASVLKTQYNTIHRR